MKKFILVQMISFATGVSSPTFAQTFAPKLEEDHESIAQSQAGSTQKPLGLYDNVVFAPQVPLIRMAQRSIDIEIYQMKDPSFREALREALTRKVRIRVVQDPKPLGDTCPYFTDESSQQNLDEDCQDMRLLVAQIRSAGGAYVPFNKQQLCGQEIGAATARCFQHGKLILIDANDPVNARALLSTGNFNSSSLCNLENSPSTCNRDFSYVTRDKRAIAYLKSIFQADLKGERLSQGYEQLQEITVSPFSRAPLQEFLASARTSILLQNQYLNDAEFNAELMAAAKRGLKVQVMLASDCSFGPPNEEVKAKLEERYREMESAGIKLRFFTASMSQKGRRGYLHAKAIVVDEKIAWVGSVNGSTGAFDVNREFGIFFSNPARVSKLSKVIQGDLTHPQSSTWQEAFTCAKDRPAN